MSLKDLDLPTRLLTVSATEITAVVRRLAGESTHAVLSLGLSGHSETSGLLAQLDPGLFFGCETRTVLDASSQSPPMRSPAVGGGENPGDKKASLTKRRSSSAGSHRNVIIFRDRSGAAVALLEELRAAEVQLRWSWGDPERFVHRLAADVERQISEPIKNPLAPPPLQSAELDLPAPSSVVREDPPHDPQRSLRGFSIPPHIHLRDYQKDAIRAWIGNGGRGILAMATGAGKTLTALCLASKVAERNSPFVVIVVCPYLNLATQWIREMAPFGLIPVPCFHGREKWERPLQDAYQRLSAGLSDCVAIVASNATFLSPAFQQALRPMLAQHLLIADEVHNLGAVHLKNALPGKISLRLGLSATPERHGDAAGTAALFDYFGPVVYEFNLERAIKEGVLVPYHYHPVLVDLTGEEAESYRELTVCIGRAFAKAEDEAKSDQLKMLLIKRARLLASAANKLPALATVLRKHAEPVEKAIVYCGDGTVDCHSTAESERQIAAVTRLLGDEHGLKVRRFTCEETSQEREAILTAVRVGHLNALVAIRCLDEGIDVPDVRLGFLLASSTNPRQFIQRRGRLLRRAPGKYRAVIYDFIVRPPSFGGGANADAFNVERRLFGRELGRILEFCRSAENGPVALHQLQDLRITYNLLAH